MSRPGRRPKASTRPAFRGLALPDVHFPFHDPRALQAVLQYVGAHRWDAVVQLGDLLDLKSISRFSLGNPTDQYESPLLPEFAAAREFAVALVRAARRLNSNCRVVFLEGNHEVRLLKFEALHPQLRGMFDVERILDCEVNAIDYVRADSQGLMARFEWAESGVVFRVRDPQALHSDAGPGVTVTHGLSHALHSAKATAEMMPWAGPVLYGHVHTRATFTAKRWGLLKPYGVTCGTLSLPVQEYTHGKPTTWEQGVGEFVMDPETPGLCDAYPLRLLDGKLIGLDGQVYSSPA